MVIAIPSEEQFEEAFDNLSQNEKESSNSGELHDIAADLAHDVASLPANPSPSVIKALVTNAIRGIVTYEVSFGAGHVLRGALIVAGVSAPVAATAATVLSGFLHNYGQNIAGHIWRPRFCQTLFSSILK